MLIKVKFSDSVFNEFGINLYENDPDTLPENDNAWYLELVKQKELDDSDAPIIKDWS